MLLSSPHDVTSILGHTATTGIAIVFAKLMSNTLTVNRPTISCGPNKVNSLVNTHISQSLRIIVEGLLGESLDHKDDASHITNTATNGLSLRFIKHRNAIINQRILTEEITSTLSGLLKQGRVRSHTNGNLAIDRGTIASLGQSPCLRLALENKGTYSCRFGKFISFS